MTIEQLFTQLIGHGPIGVLAAVCLYIAWRKDREVKTLQSAGVKAAESYAAEVKALYETQIAKMEQHAERDKAMFLELNETVRLLRASTEE